MSKGVHETCVYTKGEQVDEPSTSARPSAFGSEAELDTHTDSPECRLTHHMVTVRCTSPVRVVVVPDAQARRTVGGVVEHTRRLVNYKCKCPHG